MYLIIDLKDITLSFDEEEIVTSYPETGFYLVKSKEIKGEGRIFYVNKEDNIVEFIEYFEAIKDIVKLLL